MMTYILIAIISFSFTLYIWSVERRMEHIRVLLRAHDNMLFPTEH